jgi:hypothetical protein
MPSLAANRAAEPLALVEALPEELELEELAELPADEPAAAPEELELLLLLLLAPMPDVAPVELVFELAEEPPPQPPMPRQAATAAAASSGNGLDLGITMCALASVGIRSS